MKSNNRLHVYIIGDDNFSLACSKLLLNHPFAIKAICTRHPNFTIWANNNNIPVYQSYNAFEQKINKAKQGFLFSILNSKIISPLILNKINFFCINYHNALLPLYAGSHATSWAIINEEPQQGVTWHLMSEQVDSGDIIKQDFFEIEETDTAISLNLKCTDLGLKLFNELVMELPGNHWKTQKQNLSLRTYYAKATKPKANGLINWTESGEYIERLSRAFNYAHTMNDFSVTKLGTDESLNSFIVKNISLLNKKSLGNSGRIIKISDAGIEVSTSSCNIVVSGFIDTNGNEVSIKKLQKNKVLQIGDTLPVYDNKTFELFQSISEDCAKYEESWVSKFSKAKIPGVPSVFTGKIRGASTYREITNFHVDSTAIQQITNLTGILPNMIIFSFIVAYLQRINNYENFDIGITSKELFHYPSLSRLFFNFSWFNCSFDPEQSFEIFLQEINSELNKSRYKKNCLKDVLARYTTIKDDHVYPSIVITLNNVDIESISASFIIKIDNSQVSSYINLANEKIEKDQYSLIENMGPRLGIMLEKLKDNVGTQVYKLPIFASFDFDLYHKHFSYTDKKNSSHKKLIRIFEEQVIKYPFHISVVDEGKKLTYLELNNQANKLAKLLLKDNIKPGNYVGVTSLPGMETIVAIIAILKVGAIYVPIDPLYPDTYLGYILNDLNPPLILSKQFSSHGFKTFLTKYYPHIRFHFFYCDNDSSFISNLNLSHENKIAYVMYTSGSTGRPKGVSIPESGIIRLVINNNFLTIKPDYKIAQASNLSFDASTFEIWGALLNGATLICIGKQITLDPFKLKNVLMENHIDILWLTSSLFDQHTENNPQLFQGLKYLLAGGDVVNAATIKKVFSHNKHIEIINGYGPTENTTFSITYRMKPDDEIKDYIPIGKPIAETQAYAVDRYLQPVLAGVPGELLLGGAGLATHYISSQSKNTDAFIETAAVTGQLIRLYKTGDYVKWLPGGNFVYLGRKDSQIKLRGFRIEINTIRHTLLNHQKISCCHLAVSNNQLCAYVVVKKTSSLTKSELLNYLSEYLPYYMLPTGITFLDYLPLNPSGKVDLAAIQTIDSSLSKRRIIKPTKLIEQKLLEIWRSILNQETISIDDSFFEIGGNSLLISTLIMRIDQAFNYRMPLSEFINNPTIMVLADLIEGNKRNSKITPTLLRDLDFDLHAISNQRHRSESTTQSTLITGASGFLGAHLACESIRARKNVICIVRADNRDAAYSRLKRTFNKWNLPTAFLKKITILAGDIAEPQFGLEDEDYNHLVDGLVEIYHSAAEVNHIYGYEQLRLSNVVGTKNLLKLVHLNKDIKFTYVSTLSTCFDHFDENNTILETFIEEDTIPKNINDGYSLTKWVGEKLMTQMYKNDSKIKIFRPAWISGDTRHGRSPLETNHLYLLLKACIQLGYAPSWSARINMTPVDELARILVSSSMYDKGVFNVVSDQPILWTNLIMMLQEYGHKIKIIDPEKWYEILSEVDETNALYPLLSIYTDNQSRDWILKQDALSFAHCENYRKISAQSEQNYIDKSILIKYLTYANHFLYSDQAQLSQASS